MLDLPLGPSCGGTMGVLLTGWGQTNFNLSMRLWVWVPALLRTHQHMILHAGQSGGVRRATRSTQIELDCVCDTVSSCENSQAKLKSFWNQRQMHAF